MQDDFTRYEEMMSFLPWYYQDSKIMQGIMHGDAEDVDAIRADIMFIFSQFYIDTATESGVVLWEKELGITPISGATLELRKAQIKAKLQRPAIMTPKQIQSIANLFTKSGGAVVTEVPGSYHFHVKIPFGDLIWPAEMKEAIREAKPAHLGFDVALKWGRIFLLNSSGGIERVEIPGKSWIEKRPYIVFDTGMNGSGVVATRTSSRTDTTTHRAIVFTGGRTNGTFTTNRSGGYAVNRKDVGHDVTDTWSVFSGDRLNSRASPHTNDAASATKSRTYHRPDWQDVVSWDGVNTNGSAHKTNTWSDSKTVTKSERYFVHPLFSLNCMGSITSEHMDVGGDVEITETLFSGSTLNGSGASSRTDISTRTVTTRSIVFTGGRLNGRGRLLTNEASSRTDTSSQAITTETVSRIFAGPRTNGTIRTNSGMPERTTHTVHIPKWRNVLHRTSGATTNYSKHRTKTTEIIHTIPGRTEKRFDPSIGTLTNDHAVMGYLRL